MHVVGEGHRHVLGVGVVDELQADAGEAGQPTQTTLGELAFLRHGARTIGSTAAARQAGRG
mgnify:CR=1 FL=1